MTQHFARPMQSNHTVPGWHGQPVALRIRKPGRGSAGDGWVVAAKVTFFASDRTPVLAVAWRNQRGCESWVSVHRLVLDYAKGGGCQNLYIRDDKRQLMARLPLALVRQGRLRSDGEYYVSLADFESIPWREWHWAGQVVDLAEPPPIPAQPEPKQPGLPGLAEALR